MGTIPTTPTFTASEKLTAAKLTQMNSAANFWALTPRCYAYQGTATTSLTTAVWGVLGLDTEVYDVVQSGDTPSHDLVTDNSRVYARTTGKYEFVAGANFAVNATGVRGVNVRLNAAGAIGSGTSLTVNYQGAVSGQASSAITPTLEVALTAGDYLEVFGYQNSGGALSTAAGLGSTFLRIKLTGS